MPLLVGAKKVCAWCSISRFTLIKWIKKYDFPCIKFDRHITASTEEILVWFQEIRKNSKTLKKGYNYIQNIHSANTKKTTSKPA